MKLAQGMIAVALTVVAGFLGYIVVGLQQPAAAAGNPEISVNEKTPVNPFAQDNGKHLIAFVVTASDCGWASQPFVMNAVGRLRHSLNDKYRSTYARVSVIGVILDRDLAAGLAFLDELSDNGDFQPFDQVSVGGSWLNEEMVRFIWRESVMPAASPQVLVVERTIDTSRYLSESTIGVASDKILRDLVGSASIVEWITDGVPLGTQTEVYAAQRDSMR